MRAAIWDSHVKDMGLAVRGSSPRSPTQEVTSDMKFTVGAISMIYRWTTGLLMLLVSLHWSAFTEVGHVLCKSWLNSISSKGRKSTYTTNMSPQNQHHCLQMNRSLRSSILKSVKCYLGGRKIHWIPSISGILSQKCYHCVQYTRRHPMRLISHC